MATDGGRLVLIFDDGPAEDFEVIRPVLRSAGAPACFAVNPCSIDSSGHLSAAQLETLRDDGCEIAAHGREHRLLRGRRLARDAPPGVARLSVVERVTPDGSNGIHPGDRLEVTDGRNRETVIVADRGTDGARTQVELESAIDGRYASHDTVVRPTEELLHDEIVGAADDLLGLGFDPRTFVFPCDAADVRAWTIARRHYDAIPNASAGALPNPPGTPLANLRRSSFQTDALTPVELGEYLDAVAETGGLGVLAGHSARDTVSPERVAWVIEAARDRGIALTTFRDIVVDGGVSV